MRLADVTAIASASRAEVSAANARAQALSLRPAIVSALEDPMISAAVDHYPYAGMMDGGRPGRDRDSHQIQDVMTVRGTDGNQDPDSALITV